MKLTFLHKGNDLKDTAVARFSPADLLCETVVGNLAASNKGKQQSEQTFSEKIPNKIAEKPKLELKKLFHNKSVGIC